MNSSLRGFIYTLLTLMSLVGANFPLTDSQVQSIRGRKKFIFGEHDVLRGKDQDPLSPEGSWYLFNQNDALQKKRNGKRKCKLCNPQIPGSNSQGSQEEEFQGRFQELEPAGEPFAFGEVQEYIKAYLKDIMFNKSISPFSMRRIGIPVAFAGYLPKKEIIPAKEASIIRGVTLPSPGSSQLVRGVVLKDGKLYVSRSGIYHVSASISFLKRKKEDESPRQETKVETPVQLMFNNIHATVYLCVDDCYRDRRLQWSGSLEDRTQTATLTGHIILRKGQALALYFVNPSRFSVELSAGSTLSAVFMGP